MSRTAKITLVEVRNHDGDGVATDPLDWLFGGLLGGSDGDSVPADGPAAVALSRPGIHGTPMRMSVDFYPVCVAPGDLPATVGPYPLETPVESGVFCHLAAPARDVFQYGRWPPSSDCQRLEPDGWAVAAATRSIGRTYHPATCRLSYRVHLCNATTDDAAADVCGAVYHHEARAIALAMARKQRPSRAVFVFSDCMYSIVDIITSIATLVSFHTDQDATGCVFIIPTSLTAQSLGADSAGAHFVCRRVAGGTMFLHGFSPSQIAVLGRCSDAMKRHDLVRGVA